MLHDISPTSHADDRSNVTEAARRLLAEGGEELGLHYAYAKYVMHPETRWVDYESFKLFIQTLAERESLEESNGAA